MKLKNNGMLQQHLEKIVLGVCVLAAGAVIYMFVLSGYKVEVNVGRGTKTMSPTEIEKALAERGDSLKAKVEANRPSLQSKQVPEYHKDLEDRLGRLPVPLDRLLPKMGSGGMKLPDLGDTQIADVPFYMPQMPALAALKTRADYGVLEGDEFLTDYFAGRLVDQGVERDDADKRAPIVAAQYGKMLETPDPRDTRYVTIGTSIESNEIQESFAADPPEAGMRNVPENRAMWATLVTDVVLERQTLNQQTGQWGPTEKVASLPGFASMRDVTLDPDDPNVKAQMQVVMKKVFDNQEELATPEFPPLAEHSRPWVSPLSEEKQLDMDDRRKLNDLRHEIELLRRTIEREQQNQAKERQLKRGNNRRRPGQPMRPDDFYGGGYEEEMMSGGRDGGRMRPRPTPARPRTTAPTAAEKAEERIEQAQAKLDEKLNEYSELSGEDISNLRQRENRYRGRGGLGAAGFEEMMMMEMGGYYGDPYGDPYGGAYAPAPQFNFNRRRPNNRRRGGSGGDVEEGKIEVWAHDLTVKSGNVYRYRITVHLFNPLFQRRNLPADQHEKYFNKLSIATPASDWSEEVTIRPQPQWFLVDAKSRDQVATVEMWTIYNGRPERVEFKLNPGDVIGGEGEIEKIQVNPERRRERRKPKKDDDEDPVLTEKIRLEVAAAVVDVHQPGSRGGVVSPIMRYVDLGTGQVMERTVRDDKDSGDRIFYSTERDLQVGLDSDAKSSSSSRKPAPVARRTGSAGTAGRR